MLKFMLTAKGFKQHALQKIVDIIGVHHTFMDEGPEHLDLIAAQLANITGRKTRVGGGWLNNRKALQHGITLIYWCASPIAISIPT
jgi:hypothetical protein